jgi:hypothetical protein
MHRNSVVVLPRVHMAGSGALHQAHIEVGDHGLALFLSPDSPFPVLDIDGTREELRDVISRLAAALRDPDTSVEQSRRGAWDLSS